MFKQIQIYINFLIVCLIVNNTCLAQVGCTDPLAYNCAESIAGAYVNQVGPIIYDYSCDGTTDAGTENCSESTICEGYYDPDAITDDGSCRYPQAPQGAEVVFNLTSTAINVHWSAFNPPALATLVSYHVQRCVGLGCSWIEDFAPADVNTATFFADEYITDPDFEYDAEIKYAIAVKYSNNPYWGWAIGASYIYPPNLGNINGDADWNVLDIVALANCVLAQNCEDMTYSYACDMNVDGNFNVLDIVALANCVLAQNCG